MNNPAYSSLYPVICYADGRAATAAEACLACETLVALHYSHRSEPVLIMASPIDLNDLVAGFALSQGIIEHIDELDRIEFVHDQQRIDTYAQLTAERLQQLHAIAFDADEIKHRQEQRSTSSAPLRVAAAAICRALDLMPQRQAAARLTGCTQAAAWCATDGEILILREDVSRHAAFDKMIGARAALAKTDGFAVITSRSSYEIVRKAAQTGIALVVAVSAPTGLAVDFAERSAVTLVGFARQDHFTLYSHPERVII